ncbi:unnamed protein product [Caenorhabditis sp. 36 PRJEB53466]|nr:unnamed protein product [Caenorhabditis sp. 36 PRJEB53466]
MAPNIQITNNNENCLVKIKSDMMMKTEEEDLTNEQIEQLIEGMSQLDLSDGSDSKSTSTMCGGNQPGDRVRQNAIFMYNFFCRRKSRARATEYFAKIEAAKMRRMIDIVSEVRELAREYCAIPVEHLRKDVLEERERIRKRALKWTLYCYDDGERLVDSIVPPYAIRLRTSNPTRIHIQLNPMKRTKSSKIIIN